MEQRNQLEQLKDFVLARRDYCQEYRRSKFDPIFEAAIAEYNCDPMARLGVDNTLNFPEIYKRVETRLAHGLAEFYGYSDSPIQPFGDVYETHQRAPKIAMLWDYRCRQMNLNLQMSPFFRQAYKLGPSIAYVGWEKRFDTVPTQRDNTFLGARWGRHKKDYRQKVYDGPQLAVLDLLTCAVDPEAKSCDMDEVFDINIDMPMSKERVYQMVEEGQYSREAFGKIDWSRLSSVDTSKVTTKTIEDIQAQDAPKKAKVDECIVAEWWGRWTPPGGSYSIPLVVTIADPDGQKIMLRPWESFLRQGNHPYDHGRKPFVAMNCVTRDFCFYGKGLYEICQPVNDEYQRKMNQRLRNVNVLLNRMFIADMMRIKNPDQLKAQRPGGIVEVEGDPRGVVFPLEFPNLVPDFGRMIASLEDYLDEITLVSAIQMQGAPNNDAKTPISAEEAHLRGKASSEALKFSLGTMMEQGPVKIAEMVLQLEGQFLTESQTLMVPVRQGTDMPKPKFFEISPEDLKGRYSFFYVGDPLRINEALLRNQQATMVGIMTNPFFTQQATAGNGVVQPWPLAKQALEIMKMPYQEVLIPVDNIADKIFAEYMAVAQQQNAAMMQEMMAKMGAMGAGGGPEGQPQQKQQQEGQQAGQQGQPQPTGTLQLPTIQEGNVEQTPGLPGIPTAQVPLKNPVVPAQGGMSA